MAFQNKITENMTGVILSANDVVATVLFIEENEDEVSPKGISSVHLPYDTASKRQKDPQKNPIYSRGDVIQVKTVVEKSGYSHLDMLDDLITCVAERDEDEANTVYKVYDSNIKFDKDWKETCLKERVI